MRIYWAVRIEDRPTMEFDTLEEAVTIGGRALAAGLSVLVSGPIETAWKALRPNRIRGLNRGERHGLKPEGDVPRLSATPRWRVLVGGG